ncbi:hypothetical protein PV325_011705 [Microctonus aethiopoides]|nr:hypothetical protein PV325_011705 [Microctonus aethiopoides]KAK0092198.1 hypothetical protein PV326_001961 [Microctonus aethiopoides]
MRMCYTPNALVTLSTATMEPVQLSNPYIRLHRSPQIPTQKCVSALGLIVFFKVTIPTYPTTNITVEPIWIPCRTMQWITFIKRKVTFDLLYNSDDTGQESGQMIIDSDENDRVVIADNN